jgi:CubicO group peptidase (beta-lactamase class C family)
MKPPSSQANHSIFLIFYFMLMIGFHGSPGRAQGLYFPPVTGGQWDTIPPAVLGWNVSAINDLYQYLDARNTKAFILLKEGRIVLEHYSGTFTSDSLWYWASAGKSLTAFLIGLAQEEQLLSISDTVSKHLGAGWTIAPPGKEEKITLWHQLTMTTGLDDQVTDPDCTLPSCLTFQADAGTRWAYHNAPYTLLDEVIQAASGVAMNTIIAQKLAPVTGFSGLYLPMGYNRVFFSKPRMMARFGLLVLNRGVWDTTTIMADTAYFSAMVNSTQTMNPAYGYLWWLNGKNLFMVPGLQMQFNGMLCPNAPADMIMALGKNGQILNVVPSQNLVLVRMGNHDGASPISTLFNDTIWQYLNHVMVSGIQKPAFAVDQGFTLTPNPTSSICRIVPADAWMTTPYRYRILGAAGQLIFAGAGLGEVEFDASHLPPGVYMAEVTTMNHQQWRSRFVRR